MAYLVIEDFRGGVDRRRPIYASKPGTLWSCSNAHISMGGDIDVRKAFVDRGSFSAQTFGLVAVGSARYTFGSSAAAAVTVPSGVTYQQLVYNGGAMTRFIDHDLFDGRIYVIAEFGDGSVQHFYDGVLVADWNDGIVRASMNNLAGMATALAALINASANYSATAAGNVITVTAAATNLAFTVLTLAENGGAHDDETLTYVTTTPAGVGVSQVGTLTLGGTFDPGDRFGVALSTGSPTPVAEYFGNYGKPFGNATCVKTHKRKVYAGAGSLLFFCGVNEPLGWNEEEDAGAGFIPAANHVGGSEVIASLEVYQGRLSVFSRSAVQLWTMQADDALNNPDQFLLNTGTRAPRSTLEFAGNDVFYLDDMGVRSLRARDASNNAFASGVGAAINPVVRDWMRDGASQAQTEGAVAVVEPVEGRFWLAIGTRVFVYSFFPDTGIAAWTWYDLDFTITDIARSSGQVWARGDDNTLYLYGGSSGEQYDVELAVDVQIPFTTAQKAGTFKQFLGMDMAALGEWSCEWLLDPNELASNCQMGSYDGVTFPKPNWAGQAKSTHIAPHMTFEGEGPASISQIALYYEGAEVST
jgi:hypothetical protein